MKIKNLIIEKLQIPFKQTFSHASATRSITESVLVKAESENGLVGYGEGCPRAYVTGETMQTVYFFFNNHTDQIAALKNLEDIRQWVQVHKQAIDQNPAAWCAIELALLDLLGKETQKTIEALLSLPKLSGVFQYTAVLSSGDWNAYQRQLQQYTHTGFIDYKLKLSGNLKKDREKIDALRELGREIRLRLDANNLWETAEQAIEHIRALNYSFFAIEEPLQANNYDGCHAIYKALKIPIILDESFLQLAQFKHITKNPSEWIINLRISKMGGVIRSLAIAGKAKELGIPCIIGAQVGETSILTRAALTIANAYRDILLAQEGAFGTHLLTYDLIAKPIMFGKKGILESKSLENGFGLTVHS